MSNVLIELYLQYYYYSYPMFIIILNIKYYHLLIKFYYFVIPIILIIENIIYY